MALLLCAATSIAAIICWYLFFLSRAGEAWGYLPLALVLSLIAFALGRVKLEVTPEQSESLESTKRKAKTPRSSLARLETPEGAEEFKTNLARAFTAVRTGGQPALRKELENNKRDKPTRQTSENLR